MLKSGRSMLLIGLLFLSVGLFVLFFLWKSNDVAPPPIDIRYQAGHAQHTGNCWFNREGTVLVSMGGVVKIWDIKRHFQTSTIPGRIRSAPFSAGGERLVAIAGGAVRIHDARTGALLSSLDLPEIEAELAIFGPRDQRLAVGSVHETVYVVDISTGTVNSVLKGLEKRIEGLAFSSDGKLLAGLDRKGNVMVWDLKNQKTLHRWNKSRDSGWQIAFGRQDELVVVTAPWGPFIVWNVRTGKVVHEAETDQGVHGPSSLCAGKNFFTRITQENTVQILDPQQDRLVREIELNGDIPDLSSADGIAVHVASNTLAALKERRIILCDLARQEVISQWPEIQFPVRQVVLGGSGQKLASIGAPGAIQLWDLRETVLKRSVKLPNNEIARKLVCKGEDFWLLSRWKASQSPPMQPGAVVMPLDAEAAVLRRLPSSDILGKMTMANVGLLSPNGHTAVGKGRHLRLVDLMTEKVVKFRKDCNALAFSPNGKFLLAESYDGNKKVLKVPSLKEIQQIPIDVIHEVTFSRNSKWLAIAGARYNEKSFVKIWNLRAGKWRGKMELPWGDDCRELVLSPDNRILAISSVRCEILLWDTDHGELIDTLRGHKQTAVSLTFTSDGQFLISGGLDGTIRFWDVETGEWVLAMAPVGGKDYLAWTPDGSYKGTRAGEKKAVALQGGIIEPLKEYRKTHYRPDIVENALKKAKSDK